MLIKPPICTMRTGRQELLTIPRSPTGLYDFTAVDVTFLNWHLPILSFTSSDLLPIQADIHSSALQPAFWLTTLQQCNSTCRLSLSMINSQQPQQFSGFLASGLGCLSMKIPWTFLLASLLLRPTLVKPPHYFCSFITLFSRSVTYTDLFIVWV